MRLVFVVQGEDVPIIAPRWLSLTTAIELALHASYNLGRPIEDWEARSESGRLLDPVRPVEQIKPDGHIYGPLRDWSPLVYLSLAVGCGGAR